MNPVFVDRVGELSFLEDLFKRKGRQLAVIYGRRRIGKTELLNHFSAGKKHVYFLADKRGTLSNAERFAGVTSAFFNDVKPEAKNFDDVFLYLKNRLGNEKMVVVIDEFSYLVEKDDSIPSVFQLVFDEVLKDSNVFLVLCGSSISMMFRGVLSYESPLYGRRTGEWFLKSIPFRSFVGFFPSFSFEELVMAYAVVGGIPAYAANFGQKNVFENIFSKILSKGEFLYNEPEILLKEELREPSTYFSILEAMSGSTKLSHIANLARVPAKDLPKYLKVLEGLELVYKIIPVTEKKSKKSLYFIKDNFFRFWFGFVYPRKSELEGGHAEEVLGLVKRDFNVYLGQIFEQVCKEYLEYKKIVPFSRIGKWWSGGKSHEAAEIDIMSIDETMKTVLFAECKWREKTDGLAVLNSLKEKAKKVDWHKDKRKEYFAVFAKSFKNRPKEQNVFFFDAADLGNFKN